MRDKLSAYHFQQRTLKDLLEWTIREKELKDLKKCVHTRSLTILRFYFFF